MKNLIIAFILVAALIGCAPASNELAPTPVATILKVDAASVSAQGYIIPVHHTDLAFSTSGRVAEVLVAEGDLVKAGQPLVNLQNVDVKAKLTQAQADLKLVQNGARLEEIAIAQANLDIANGQLQVAQTDLARLQNGSLNTQIAAAQAAVVRAQADFKVTQDSYDALVLGPGHGVPDDLNTPGRGLGAYEEQKRAQLAARQASYSAAQKRLTQTQAEAGFSLQSIQAGVGIATAQRDAAQAQLALIKAGATIQQINAAQARLAQAQAAFDETTLDAPFAGTIAELTINVGEIAKPGASIVSVADLNPWEVETDDLNEVDVVHVHIGAPVFITLDALPGLTLKGQVTSMTPHSAIKRGDVTYTVKIAITDSDPRLKWGMTAHVDIRPE